jgi:flagellar L-ring protein precursor FlgH
MLHFEAAMTRHMLVLLARCAAGLFVLGALAGTCLAIPRFNKVKPSPTTSALEDYIRRVRDLAPLAPTSTGSLWVSSGPLSNPASDYKARTTGDLVLIHLADNFTAATNGENKQSRQFSSQSAITGLVGKVGLTSRLQNLFNANSNTGLDGKGQSTLSSNVNLNLAAQVKDVLPNGVLIVEAARDITVGNDRQTVVVRGLVRPGDLAADNSVASALVSNLEVEIKGKGAVAEATRQPNPIVRALLRILTF